ncbi:MAG: ribosomal protein L16, partial [Armatimonadetes bacterium]|nr:ribosomal protein L16 [Armatimonadota bacterium]
TGGVLSIVNAIVRLAAFPAASVELPTRTWSPSPATAVPLENGWPSRVAVVVPGRVMFEIAGAEPELMREALTVAAHKLSVSCRIVTREDLDNAS